MRDEIIKRNLIVNSISLLVFFMLSLITFSYFNKKNMEDDLYNISSIIENNLKNTEYYSEMIEISNNYSSRNIFLNIVLADNYLNIFYDSSDDSIGSIVTEKLDEDEISNIGINNNIYSTKDSIFYISKIDDFTYLRTEIKNEFNSNYILLSIFFVLVILIFDIFITYFISKKTSNNIIDKFTEIREHLRTVNSGEYNKINSSSNYPEICEIVDEINEINSNLYNSFRKIINERNKQSFIINNMDQGLVIINENGQVELINNFALDVLNIKEALKEKEYYSNIIPSKSINLTVQNIIKNRNNTFFDIFDDDKNKTYSITFTFIKNKWNDLNESIGLIIILIDDVTLIRANDEIKKDFISNASHELKSPITSIRGFSELLLSNKSKLDEKTIKYLNIIYNESEKMKNTIDDLLYLSKLESNENVESLKRNVYFKDVVDDVLESFEDGIKEMNLTINNLVDNTYLYIENELLSHIIRNLIENAIRYNKPNGSITISTRNMESSIELSISDTGIGIDEKFLDRIYERFFRVDKSHNRSGNSTGLGLNIVKRTADILGAKITVNSTVNVGTTFTINFNKLRKE